MCLLLTQELYLIDSAQKNQNVEDLMRESMEYQNVFRRSTEEQINVSFKNEEGFSGGPHSDFVVTDDAFTLQRSETFKQYDKTGDFTMGN